MGEMGGICSGVNKNKLKRKKKEKKERGGRERWREERG